MSIYYMPCPEVKKRDCVLLSNTCDMAKDNSRKSNNIFITYAPIYSLQEFSFAMRKSGYTQDYIDSFEASIRAQYITNIFYLPPRPGVEEECIIHFDMLNCCVPDVIKLDNGNMKRLFSLSLYGRYLFLIKLSIHFTRMGEA